MSGSQSETPDNQHALRQGELQRPIGRRSRRTQGLTPLDHLLIDAAVDSRKAVVGALNERDLNGAVEELISLNERRQQSYFHAGFRDALLDRPFDAETRADTERRARWYWTGAIQGLARTQSWSRIVELYESTGTVRTLGDGRGPASRMAGEHVAEALWKAGRTSDLHLFVGERLARKPTVFSLLLDAGTESLRSHVPGVARNLFKLLLTVGDSLKADDPLIEHLPTVRRRMAHCLRLLGEHQGAESFLRDLLREDGEPAIHAMVHADLGLLQGRFALLDEVRIPDERPARRDLVDRLKAGEEHYQNAVANPDAAFASHGHYCLGVLSLADDDLGDDRFSVADAHLEKAHAEIHGSRGYPKSLLAQINLYMGIAKSQLLDAAEIRHAARLIVSGLEDAEIPQPFVEPMIASLACSEESIEMVVGPLLESGRDEALNALANSEILKSHPQVAKRLHKRAGMSNRRPLLAADDLRRALRGYLGVGDVEAAREVLDELEQLAFHGTDVAEFLEILSDQDRYGPAWNTEDAALARVRCLEALGEFAEALAVLRTLFHRYISRSEHLNALGVLEQIETYGLDQKSYIDLNQRYDAFKPIDDSDSHGLSGPVKVLVVGGNETQEKIARQVRAKLAARDPQVTPDFVHTGWGSNWNKFLGEIEKRVANCDAVVVMRFIRTQLGRHVRAICREGDVPWRLCGSGGQGGQVEAVLTVAGVARGMQ